jgi:hypothetical protein
VPRTIGSLNETPFHAELKRRLAPPGSRFEVDVDGYVVDVVADDLLIEVQTRNVSGMRTKLAALLPSHRLRLVLPVAERKWIVRCFEDGSRTRRRSPKRGRLEDVFRELVSIPDLLAHPNFEVEVALTEQEELRRHHPGKAWRRRGWVVVGRELVAVGERRRLVEPGDLLALLPPALPDPFGTADLAALGKLPRRTAQEAAYCLRALELITPVGKAGNAVLYRTAVGR